jgi:hypothetical protein
MFTIFKNIKNNDNVVQDLIHDYFDDIINLKELKKELKEREIKKLAD